MANLAAEARAKAQEKWAGATVHARGRNWIRHQHPTEPNRFMLDTHIGPIHYGPGEDQEIDTAWQVSGGAWDYEAVDNNFRCYVRDSVPVSYRYEDVATGHWVELTVNAVEWVNDEGQSEAAASFSQVTPTIDDDTIRWSDIATGWNIRVEAQTARLAKWLTIDSLANLGAPTIGGTNEQLQISLTFTRSNNLQIWADGVQWNEQNNTWIETADHIEFRDSTSGEPVFWFKKPAALDQDADAPAITQRTRRLGANFYAEINVPWSWLQSAVFPIEIDPTIDPQVSASGDDGYADGASNFGTTDTNRRYGYAGGRDWYPWAVWVVDGPTNGDDIDVAYASLCAHGDDGSTGGGTVYFVKETDSAPPTSYSEWSTDHGNHTSASVYWWLNGGSSVTAGTFYDTGSLVTVVQEIVDQASWPTGSKRMQAHFDGDNSQSDNYIRFYDYASGDAPKLHIEYTAAGGEPSPDITDPKVVRRQLPGSWFD